MKKIYALLAVVLVSTTAFAKEPGEGSKSTGLAVVKRSESAFTLFYQNAGVTDVQVLINDANGKQVYSESVRKTDGFIRQYTLSDLSEGEYSVSVVDGENKLTEKFYYGNLNTKKSARIIKIDDSRYLIAIPSTLYSGDARIKIFSDGELAHQQLVETGNDFGKIFNLKNLSGNLTFEITDSAGKRIN